MTATGIRLLEWARRNAPLVVAGVLALGLLLTIFVGTYRIYDERTARLTALQDTQIDFCNRGNVLRAALRDYLHQTIVIRPVPPGLDPAAAAEAQARNQAAQEALERGDRSFAPVDCAALAEHLGRSPKGTP